MLQHSLYNSAAALLYLDRTVFQHCSIRVSGANSFKSRALLCYGCCATINRAATQPGTGWSSTTHKERKRCYASPKKESLLSFFVYNSAAALLYLAQHSSAVHLAWLCQALKKEAYKKERVLAGWPSPLLLLYTTYIGWWSSLLLGWLAQPHEG